MLAPRAESLPAPRLCIRRNTSNHRCLEPYALADWDTEGSDPSEEGIVEIPDGRGGTQLAAVAEYPVTPLSDLEGTETEAALKAAGLELTQPAAQTVARRWVLFSFDTNSLLTTRTYDSYDEAAEDANQVDDVLVLPLVFEELHA